MPIVLNNRDSRTTLTKRGSGAQRIYVGRPSEWGNPFLLRSNETRGATIGRFAKYAIERLKTEPTWLDPLRGKDLICWCAPLPCHADILLRLANR